MKSRTTSRTARRRRRAGTAIAATAAMLAVSLHSNAAQAEPPRDLGPFAGTGKSAIADGNTVATAGSGLRTQGTLGTQAMPDGAYTSIAPARFYDSRTSGGRTPLGANETRVVDIAGLHGVPAAGQVKAIAVNVTVDAPTAASFVTVYPSGVPTPDVSSVNYRPGRTTPNLLIINVGADGKVNIFNAGGQAHVILDVVGFFSTSSGPAGAGLRMFIEPNRVLDTRQDPPVGGFTPFTTFGLGGRAGVPYATDYSTVILNTTVQAARPGFFTFYPGTTSVPPDVSNLNFPGQLPSTDPSGLVVSNTVFANLNPSGTHAGYTESPAKVNLILDELGVFDRDGQFIGDDGFLYDAPLFQAPANGPSRILDGRPGSGVCDTCGPLAGGQVFSLNFGPVLPDLDLDGVGVSAVAINVTIDSPTASTYLTVFPGDSDIPDASTLNFVAGETVAHATVVRIDPENPIVNFYLPFGAANLIVDLQGWFQFDV